jgi:hypothetical protein
VAKLVHSGLVLRGHVVLKVLSKFKERVVFVYSVEVPSSGLKVEEFQPKHSFKTKTSCRLIQQALQRIGERIVRKHVNTASPTGAKNYTIEYFYYEFPSKLPVKNDGVIYSSKHTLINIIPQGPKSLNCITMATVITHTFINIIP